MSLLLLIIPLIGISIVTIEANYGLSLINNIKIKINSFNYIYN